MGIGLGQRKWLPCCQVTLHRQRTNLLFMQDNSKLNWANNLRAAATLGVIFIHTSSYLTGSLGKEPQSNWIISIVMNTMVRWSVPVFVMLTGTFVLDNYNDKIIPFLKKAFFKIVVPFLIWSTVYLLFNFWDNVLGPNLSLYERAHFVIEKFITGTAVHLWYVYMIICVYLVIPIFARWVRASQKAEQFLFLCFWFIMLVVYPFIDRYKNDFELGFFTGYIGYLVAGYFLFKYVQLSKSLLWFLFITTITLTILGTYYLAFQQNPNKEMLLAPLTPGVFIMSASIYLLFKQASVTYPNWLSNLVNAICKYSYGIYLIHLLVLALIDDYIVSVADFNPLWSIPVISLLTMSFSFCSIYLLRKLPIIGKWIG
jgi:surface polysaccharide O-acyltransferase-like enzyme